MEPEPAGEVDPALEAFFSDDPDPLDPLELFDPLDPLDEESEAGVAPEEELSPLVVDPPLVLSELDEAGTVADFDEPRLSVL